MLSYLLVFLLSLGCCGTVSSFDFQCPYYKVSNEGYATCSFVACGTSEIDAYGCSSCDGGVQNLYVYDSNGQLVASDNGHRNCYPCDSLSYTVPGDPSSCSTYTLREECDSTSSTSCTGEVYLSGTDYPAPKSTTFTCLPYKNSGTCNFIACTGQTVTASGCGACKGDQNLAFYANGVYAESFQYPCGSCSEIGHNVPPNVNGSSQCLTYTLKEACYWSGDDDETCSGTVIVSGASECLNCTPPYKVSGEPLPTAFNFADLHVNSDGDVGAIVLGCLYAVVLCMAFAVQRGWMSLDFLAAEGESVSDLLTPFCTDTTFPTQQAATAVNPLHPATLSVLTGASTAVAKPAAANPAIVLHKFNNSSDSETDKSAADAKPADLEMGSEDSAHADILSEVTASQESSTGPAVVTEQPAGVESSAQRSQSRRLTGSHRLSLEVTSETTTDSPQYAMYVRAEDRDLFGIPGLKVKPTVYALVTLATQVFSLLSFLLSYGFSSNKKSTINACILWITGMYLAVSWVAVPVWQSFSLHYAESRSSVDCAGTGCIFCRGCVLCCGLCCHFGCQPTYFTPRTEVTCRYIPLSVYNLVFMLRHPGKCINNELPAEMPAFGFGRAYFLLMSINVRGAMYLYIFINAVVKLAQAADTSAAILAAMSLASSIVNLRLYVLSILLGMYFLPSTVMTMFLFCCIDRFNFVEQLQSKRGTRNFEKFTWVWEKVKNY